MHVLENHEDGLARSQSQELIDKRLQGPLLLDLWRKLQRHISVAQGYREQRPEQRSDTPHALRSTAQAAHSSLSSRASGPSARAIPEARSKWLMKG